MQPVTIIFQGIPPSKKNSKQLIFRGGRRYLVPSESHQVWHEENMYLLKKVKAKFQTVSYMEAIFFPKDKRIHDSTNVQESINDILVDAGIIKDDNWFVLGDIRLKFGGICGEDPRVEVTIYP